MSSENPYQPPKQEPAAVNPELDAEVSSGLEEGYARFHRRKWLLGGAIVFFLLAPSLMDFLDLPMNEKREGDGDLSIRVFVLIIGAGLGYLFSRILDLLRGK